MKIDHRESYKEFGEQFLTDSNIGDYWGSTEMLIDIVRPFSLSTIKNKVVMEVGVGSGRIINNLVKFLPKKVIAVEPSKAIKVAKKIIS
jgi:16S rRNA A1518/A1519 N6-dimethyltransferase RsmA/KsgA/DIM1 with predicted DNA glycosylase/AP lyase activity